MSIPEVIPFEAVAANGRTRDCYWQKGVCAHIRKELDEIAEGDNDPKEWVDVWLLAMDGLWRSLRDQFVELTDGEIAAMICEMIDAKQAKNEARVWPDWRTQPEGKAIQHVKGIED